MGYCALTQLFYLLILPNDRRFTGIRPAVSDTLSSITGGTLAQHRVCRMGRQAVLLSCVGKGGFANTAFSTHFANTRLVSRKAADIQQLQTNYTVGNLFQNELLHFLYQQQTHKL